MCKLFYNSTFTNEMKMEALIAQNEWKCKDADSLFIMNYLAFIGCSKAFEVK